MSDFWVFVLVAVVVLPFVLLVVWPVKPSGWCKQLEHDWVDHDWFAKCSKCPAEYNYYDRPGGAG